MVEKYPLRNQPGKTMMVYEKDGQFYGHIVSKSGKVEETRSFSTVSALKSFYPPIVYQSRTPYILL